MKDKDTSIIPDYLYKYSYYSPQLCFVKFLSLLWTNDLSPNEALVVNSLSFVEKLQSSRKK